MGRRRRVDYPGAWHHVTNRGARRGDVFEADEHCLLFLDILGQVGRKSRVEVHAYALLPNHFHLLVRSVHGNLSAAMKTLGERYTRQLNRLEGWDGPTFRGRFASRGVADEKYLRYLVAYIHLNPVRARLAKRPGDECWTSHRAHCGLERGPDWLSRDMVQEQFGSPEQVDAFVRDVWTSRLPWPEAMDRETGWLREDPECDARVARARFDHPGGSKLPIADPSDILARVREITGASDLALRTTTRGRGANPARRFAIWMLARHTRLTHAAIAHELDAPRSQVEKLLHRLGRATPPDLASWLEQWDSSDWPCS